MGKEALIHFIKNNIQNICVSDEALLTIAEQFEEREFVKNEYDVIAVIH